MKKSFEAWEACESLMRHGSNTAARNTSTAGVRLMLQLQSHTQEGAAVELPPELSVSKPSHDTFVHYCREDTQAREAHQATAAA